MPTRTMTCCVLVGLSCAGARAEQFNWAHEASGSGWALLYNGDPPDYDEEETTGPDDPDMSYIATRNTVFGSLGAGFDSHGRSQIYTPQEDRLELFVGLSVSYFPSLFPGGDVPGGEGAGELSSVVEFTMPADEIAWHYYLDIDVYYGFQGTTQIVAENVTRSRILLTLSDANQEPFGADTMLEGNAGDLIRITSTMSASGTVPPGIASLGTYRPRMRMYFTVVPEPTTLALLAPALALLPLRRRPTSIRRRRKPR